MFSRRGLSLFRSARPSLSPCATRLFATDAAWTYESVGNPKRVLKLQDVKVKQPSSGEVQLGLLAAAVNPADFNVIQGSYPVQPSQFPATAGIEGAFEVKAVGPNVEGFQVGDWVVQHSPSFGTWTTSATVPVGSLTKVSKNIKPEYAAAMTVNPFTAVRLLEDYVDLQPGDVVVQNCASGAVGHTVMQLCKLKGVKTINIIRERNTLEQEELIERMKAYGGDLVVSDNYIRTAEFRDLISDMPAPKLALNGAGGKSATEIARLLGENGTMVTYGAMSRKPIQLPSSLFIFKNITMRGFWLQHWINTHSSEERTAAYEHLSNLFEQNKLKLWLEKRKFRELPKVWEEPRQMPRKQVLVNEA